jgi:hypothetical protein
VSYFAVTALDENGTGAEFPALVKADSVLVIMHLPEGVVAGANSLLMLEGVQQPLFAAELQQEIAERIEGA